MCGCGINALSCSWRSKSVLACWAFCSARYWRTALRWRSSGVPASRTSSSLITCQPIGCARRAHLAGAHGDHGVLELRHHLAIGKPAEIAAGRGAAVLRVFACQGGEDRCRCVLGGRFCGCCSRRRRGGIIAVGAQQNVAGAVLAHRRAFGQGHALLGGAVDKGIHFFIAHA